MNTIKARDIYMGNESERFMLPHIRDVLLDSSIELSSDKFSAFDYYNQDKTICVELKTRNCRMATYPTTMIPLSKIRKCTDDNVKYYFFFRFENGIKYIRYDKDQFNTFEKKVGGRNDRGYNEYNDYMFIPVNKCITVNV